MVATGKGMKAVSFESTGVIRGDKVDVGARIVATPSSKPMLVFCDQGTDSSVIWYSPPAATIAPRSRSSLPTGSAVASVMTTSR